MKTGDLQQQKPGRDLRKRRSVLLVLLGLGLMACVLIAVTIAAYQRATGPIYNGKHLSEWLEIYGRSRGLTPMGIDDYLRRELTPLSVEVLKSKEAIHHIGSHAAPLLLDWLDYETPGWKKTVSSHTGKLPTSVRQSGLVKWLISDRADERQRMAIYAFELLGTQAASAIPELARRASLTNSVEKRIRSFGALSWLGPGAVPGMMTVVSDPTLVRRSWLWSPVAHMGTNARPFLPLLVQNLQSTNGEIAFQAVNILSRLTIDPELVVPALENSLNDSHIGIRHVALRSLANYGERARPALPTLLKTLNDPDFNVRFQATNAIRAIAPEVLTNAPGSISLPRSVPLPTR